MANRITILDTDPGFKKTLAKLKNVKRHASAVEIGIFSEKGGDLVIYASANEFGVPSGFGSGQLAGKYHNVAIPERSFLRSTYEECKPEIIKKIEKIKIQIFAGQFDGAAFFTELGAWFKGKVQEKIAQGDFTPNAPSTLAAKAPKTHPLINTGRMRQSVAFRLVK